MDSDKKTHARAQKRAFWREHVEAWKLGNLSQKAYCTEHKIPHTTFQRWRRQFKYEDEVVERRAARNKKTMKLRYIPLTTNHTLLEERIRFLRTRIGSQNPAAAQGEGDGRDSRIRRAR